MTSLAETALLSALKVAIGVNTNAHILNDLLLVILDYVRCRPMYFAGRRSSDTAATNPSQLSVEEYNVIYCASFECFGALTAEPPISRLSATAKSIIADAMVAIGLSERWPTELITAKLSVARSHVTASDGIFIYGLSNCDEIPGNTSLYYEAPRLSFERGARVHQNVRLSCVPLHPTEGDKGSTDTVLVNRQERLQSICYVKGNGGTVSPMFVLVVNDVKRRSVVELYDFASNTSMPLSGAVFDESVDRSRTVLAVASLTSVVIRFFDWSASATTF